MSDATTTTTRADLEKAELLNARPKIVPVPLPSLGRTGHVRPLSATQRDVFELAQFERRRKGQSPNHRGLLVAMTACRADGTRLFTDEEADQVGEVDAAVLERLYDAAARGSGHTEADLENLGNG